ncbi:Midasin, partial [Zootermopsis nevadensis]
FSLKYFENNPSPFHDMKVYSAATSLSKKRKFSSKKTSDAIIVTDLEIVQSCYSFLHVSSDYFRQCWNWSDFIKMYVGHKDDFICWLACQCIADVTGMTDTQRQAFMAAHLSPKAVRACTIRFDSSQPNYDSVKEDAWKRKSSSNENVCRVSKVIVSVSGIQLPVFNPESQDKRGCLVPVNSTLGNLKSLALAVASGRAICLQGPVGSGKTSLVEHLALLTGRNTAPYYLKVQLGDQTDSKMLLGSYRCTDVPGEFVWQPGVLTQAVIAGCWILLEDVDSAAADVATVLASLVETGTLSVPGYKDCVKVAPGFQLFVTKRLLPNLSGFHIQHFVSAAFLEKHWVQINIEPLSRQELIEIVETMFPLLKTIAGRIVQVFLLFSVGNHSSTLQLESEHDKESCEGSIPDVRTPGVGRRLTSTRDLIKWCTRSVEGFDVSSQESALKVFQDAIDIFCCSVINPDKRLKLAESIGACLGIVKTKADYFCNSYKPTVMITPLRFTAGRVSLPRHTNAVTVLESAAGGSSFCFTRPAACLLERVACCVAWMEPVLLVGETGTGKTSAVQYLAEKTGHHLIVINMNQQSDSADLLGGYKPIDLKYVVYPVREEFEALFRSYFSVQKNVKFLEHIAMCFGLRQWSTLLKLMKHSHSAAMKRLVAEDSSKQKGDAERRLAWQQFGLKLLKLETQLKTQSALAFSFIEGSLVKALREGYWVLLDEINLASAETLECLSGLLDGSAGSLYLLERGDQEPIKRHRDFRLFACMNPATDVGKKDLPAGLRNRFTEFFVDELTEKSDLTLLVGTYLRHLSLPVEKLGNLVKFYLSVRKEATERLTDGTGHKPHYSLRTLCRALSVAAHNKCGSVPRSLYEALCLSFLTQLDYSSHPVVVQMVAKAVVGSTDVRSILKQPIPPPCSTDAHQYVCFEGYWVPQGNLEPNVDAKYILTPSVRRNLCDLVRIVSIGHHPVLLQGETSVGKTSLITYLAKASGNHCVRINNHEHTDLQEYIGLYSADEQGHLVFREGVLVEAMRRGHWIILDELNLAPTDVLEALNRVLDDNRELFIAETQETVKAHPHFMLFATQNPPGLYGGRKMLSRAFRNRFVELHFDEIPANELEIILHKRCDMPLSYCKKMVCVMTDLQLRRRGSAAFAGKQGFITLRDLFRWGERYRLAGEKEGTYYDWDQHIADEGYLVLAGRVRKQEECRVIQEVIKKHINRTVDPQKLFTLSSETSSVTRPILEKVLKSTVPGFKHIVWTYNMRRLVVLVGKACQFKEPVLLVGETGCGKTTVCQMLASIYQQSLYTVNCHMHTESSDFLGGLRPVRDHSSDVECTKLFEWIDGPLIEAMQKGDLFLADEISLADDSVLERLNSLLEPERKLLLAEKGSGGTDQSFIVTANPNFHFIGTMNPGGDYGKKELSPALRNRFTEIWCESCTDRNDLLAVVEHNLSPGLLLGNQEDGSSGVGSCLLDFIEWFTSTDIGKRFTVSVRDILSWVNFINVCTQDQNGTNEIDGTRKLDLATAYIHGACLTFLDSFGSGITSVDSTTNLKALHKAALKYLMEQVELSVDETALLGNVVITDTLFGIHPFYIKRGSLPVVPDDFTFMAPTTGLNASRVLRGLQLNKPILLEGSPGVGKTSLVAALAKAAGFHLTRINVSDQTDVSDLFGADLPVEGGGGGQFAWRDGPFLQALKAGHWILLDELNLASQSVLEGLNACLDHRGEVFIPELGKTFHIQSDSTRLFGAQNPQRQGGARRGLPQSFLNRFTQVYIDSLTEADLEFIIRFLFPDLPHNLISRMIRFNSRLVRETGELRLWGQRGAPWELNLRDLCRWCEAIIADSRKCSLSKRNAVLHPGKFIDLIYMDRMRTREDKEKVNTVTFFIDDIFMSRNGVISQRAGAVERIGESNPQKSAVRPMNDFSQISAHQDSLMLLRRQFPVLRSLTRCVDMNWLAILVGPAGSGKTSVVHLLSQLLGQELRVLSINSAMDTTEILGGFEQV